MIPVIQTNGLWKSYGRFGALQGVDIVVPEGSVFALLGASGAGKTTAIKVLLNMIAPSRGKATLLGVDSRALTPRVLAEVGYVSENQVMPARLRVDAFFEYLRPLYPSWDRVLEAEIRAQLRLPPTRKIGELSHGMRLKMALACALPFRPRLLILDEPLSGLDALVRDEIVGGFLRDAGKMTILISSPELDEVRLLFQGTVPSLFQHARPLFSSDAGVSERRSLRDIFVAMVIAARQGDGRSGAL
jgi:ABC-2 type transport system ATP-binding protein